MFALFRLRNNHGRLDFFDEATQAEPLEGQAQTRAERRDQQIQRILEAAKTCFVRSGFQGASMQQICAEAGMSPGALYRYFPSKEAIVEAICEADRPRTTCLLRRSSAIPSPSTGWSKARWRISAYPREGNAAPLFAEMCAESMRNETIREPADRHKAGGRRNDRAAISGRHRARRDRSARRCRRPSGRPHVDRRTAWRSTTCPSRGIPLDKIENPRPRHARRHAAADQAMTERLIPTQSHSFASLVMFNKSANSRS